MAMPQPAGRTSRTSSSLLLLFANRTLSEEPKPNPKPKPKPNPKPKSKEKTTAAMATARPEGHPPRGKTPAPPSTAAYSSALR
jgi:hypothetical protein